jgi:methionine aminotransferase
MNDDSPSLYSIRMRPLPVKHSAADTTIFTVMSSLAQQHGAINLSQGFPDFPVDPMLGEYLGEASAAGFNQYAPMAGLPQLRTAIAKGIQERLGIMVDPDSEITITPGATYGIFTALSAILGPGDEVIILEPAYDSYMPNIEMNGARVIPVALKAPEFTVDWDAIKDAITVRTRAIIVNTPHNPTGAVWQDEDWKTLAELVQNTNIIVVSDEVYEQLVYGGLRHHSVLQYPELRARSFAVYSFGKVYHNTGWKIG